MKLITSLTTPFGRKVRILLEEKGIPCEIVEDIPWNTDSVTPDYNPLGKVPVLLLDDGSSLFDSRVIEQYLDEHSGSTLIPPAGAERIAVLRWEALADGISEAAANVFIERRREAAQQSQSWIDRQLGKIRAGLNEAEHQLKGPYCRGDHFGLADIALVCALDYTAFRLSDDVDMQAFPRLTDYLARMLERPSVADTRPF